MPTPASSLTHQLETSDRGQPHSDSETLCRSTSRTRETRKSHPPLPYTVISQLWKNPSERHKEEMVGGQPGFGEQWAPGQRRPLAHALKTCSSPGLWRLPEAAEVSAGNARGRGPKGWGEAKRMGRRPRWRPPALQAPCTQREHLLQPTCLCRHNLQFSFRPFSRWVRGFRPRKGPVDASVIDPEVISSAWQQRAKR